MKLFETLEQSMKCKEAVIVGVREFEYNGNIRKSIKAKKANGKRTYNVVQYENGLFSSAV